MGIKVIAENVSEFFFEGKHVACHWQPSSPGRGELEMNANTQQEHFINEVQGVPLFFAEWTYAQ